jgi:hypothetical protein
MRIGFERRLVHVQATIELDLQTVPPASGQPCRRTISTPLYGSLIVTE